MVVGCRRQGTSSLVVVFQGGISCISDDCRQQQTTRGASQYGAQTASGHRTERKVRVSFIALHVHNFDTLFYFCNALPANEKTVLLFFNFTVKCSRRRPLFSRGMARNYPCFGNLGTFTSEKKIRLMSAK